MKRFNRHAACLAAFSLCGGSLSAGPTVVSPRAQPSANVAARSAPSNTPNVTANNHHPTPGIKIVTNTSDSAPGSLRAVLASANPGDVIKFSLRLPATISLLSTLVITQNVTIQGPSCDALTVMRTSASNAPLFRVFQIETGTVTIAGITIANGVAFDNTSYVDNVGGGIFNRGNLTLNGCVVTGNSAPSSPPDSTGFGGGIFSDVGSSLTVLNTTFSGNQATAAGGAVSTISSAFVAKGCTFSDNFAIIQGGGLNIQGQTGLIQNCTISSNSTPATGVGSAILEVAIDAQVGPMLTVDACTIAGNTGGTDYGAYALVAVNGNLGLTNDILSTIVGDNEAANFYFYGPTTFVSLGHNLDSDGSSGLVNGVNGDIVGTSGSPINPLLGPLQDNGGPTETMALLIGSPALGTGSCSDANGAPLLVDQRGFPRTPGNGCDIGAYENQPLILICPPPIVVDFQTEAGAVVKYQPKVIDLCPYVCVTNNPPSGSLFPIGETPVTVVATDGCSSNVETCGFTVTVLGPQGVKSNIVDVLEGLLSKCNSWDKSKIEAAIADISSSLSSNLWVDATHLDPQNGGQVFTDEQQAVAELQQVGYSKWGWQPPNLSVKLQIIRMVKCDRLLATVSLQDAINGGGNPVAIGKAKKEIALGDLSAALGKPTDAIQHYLNAWTLTVNL